MAEKPTSKELMQKIRELEDDLKQAEENLQESGEFRSSLLDVSPNPTIVINQDTSVRYVNPALEAITGLSAEDIIGVKAPYPWWTKETSKKTHRDLEEAMDRGLKRREEFFQKKTGERFWVEISSTPIRKNGEFQYYLANWVDITQRKQAKKALQESEERYRSLVESTEDCVYLVDRDCRYLFMNQKYLSRFGLPLSKIIGRSYGEFHSKKGTKAFAQRLKEVVESGRSLSYEYRSERDGKYFIRTLSPVLNQDGNSKAVTVVSKDITELQQAQEAMQKREERVRRVIENIFKFVPEGLLAFTDELDVLRTNKAFQDIVKKYSAKLNYTEEELAQVIIEQVRSRVNNKDYSDIRISKKQR